MTSRTVAIIQARTGSSRLPGKIFFDLQGKAVLGRVIEQIRSAQLIDQVVVACPVGPADDQIEQYVQEHYPSVVIFRGSEEDVLARYHGAATKSQADTIVRITSDCPLMDPYVIDRVVGAFYKYRVDYCANILGKRMYPRGLDVEVFSYELLDRMYQQASESDEREHVTLFVRKYQERFKTYNVFADQDYSIYRLTLDEPDDYKLINKIYGELGADHINLESVVRLLEQHPDLVKLNEQVQQKYAQY